MAAKKRPGPSPAPLLHAFLRSTLLLSFFHSVLGQDIGKASETSRGWNHLQYETVKSEVQESAHELLTLRNYEPLHVPLEVNLVLVGLAGDGGYRFNLPLEELRSFLHKSFPSYQPSCLETGFPLEIQHMLRFNVMSVSKEELISLERTLQAAMKPTGTKDYVTVHSKIVPAYEVEASGAVEQAYAALYERYFGVAARSKAMENKPGPAALFIANLDKVRMAPQQNDTTQNLQEAAAGIRSELSQEELRAQEGDYVYRYRYMGGAATAAWLSSGRFAVVDLSAGPCAYGPVSSWEGAVVSSTLPRLRNLYFPKGHWSAEAAKEQAPPVRSNVHFMGQLSTVVVSAVQHLFAPDVRVETVDFAERVLVSITVLRNHQKFNPLLTGHNHSIDLASLQTQIRRLVQPNQEVLVVGAVHSLHEHPQLAMAVGKSIRGVSMHVPVNGSSVHRVQGGNFLDGVMVLDEIRRSGDVLAAALLEVSHPDLSKKFFNKQLPTHLLEQTEKPRVGPAQGRATPGGTRPPEKAEKKGGGRKKGGLTHGTRVVPVYVFSLAGMEPGLLMANESLLATTEDAVAVLQAVNDPAVPTSFMSEKIRLSANPMAPTRHILAGVASVLGGLAPPYERVRVRGARPLVGAPPRGRRVQNWLWASGHHPFGPFSNCTALSQLHLDVVARNAIYSRVDTAIRQVRESLEAVDEFTGEYLTTPLGDRIKVGADTHWLQKLYTDKKRSVYPLPELTIGRLNQELQDIEGRLVQMAGLLYDHKWTEAHTLSSSLLIGVQEFHNYVEQELLTARESLACCRVTHNKPVEHSQQAFLYLCILGSGFLVYFLVIYFSSPQK